jgi:hypothetical protein
MIVLVTTSDVTLAGARVLMIKQQEGSSNRSSREQETADVKHKKKVVAGQPVATAS